MLLFQNVKLFLQVGANNKRVLLELLLLQYFENSVAGSGAHRVTAEGVEIASAGQHLSNLRRRDDCSYWDAIPYTLNRNDRNMSAYGLSNCSLPSPS